MNNRRISELGLIPGTKVMKGMLLIRSRNENLQQTEKVKVLKYSNIKNLITFGNTDDVEFSDFDLSRKYKDCDVRDGDIIIPIIARSDKGSVLYIEKSPTQKCVYNESNLIVRINNENINNRYVALVLDKLCQEWFKIPTTGVLPFRITVRHLERAIIPIPKLEIQNEIADKYSKAIKQQREVENMIQEMLKKDGSI